MGNARKNRCNTSGASSINVTAEHPKNLLWAGGWVCMQSRGCVCFCMNVTLCKTEYLSEEDQPVTAIFHLVSHFVLNSNNIKRIRKRVTPGSADVLLQSYKPTMYTEPKLSFPEVICFLIFPPNVGKNSFMEKVALVASTSTSKLHPQFLPDESGRIIW